MWCNFVVILLFSGFAHSLSTHLQSVQRQLETARETLKDAQREKVLAMEAALGNVVGTDPTIFNEDRTASKKASQITAWRSVAVTPCEVCGVKEEISKAHIIVREKDAETLRVDYYGKNNFLFLCGTRDSYRASDPPSTWKCYALFDRKIMSFLHVEDDDTMTKFVVIGGPHHGKTVTFTRKPHRRVLHSHFLHCVLNKSLLTPKGEVVTSVDMLKEDSTTVRISSKAIEEWVKNVTPPASPPEGEQAPSDTSVDLSTVQPPSLTSCAVSGGGSEAGGGGDGGGRRRRRRRRGGGGGVFTR